MIQARCTTKGFALVISGLETAGPRIDSAAVRALDWGLESAIGVAMREFLTGPRPARLGVRSGRLRGSLQKRITASKNGIRALLGSNIPYAPFHEFGFHGTQQVAAHTRIMAQFRQTKTGLIPADPRRKYTSDTGQFIGYRDTRGQAAKRLKGGLISFEQQVRAHTRNISYDGRPYLRPAFEKIGPALVERLKLELQKAMATGPTT